MKAIIPKTTAPVKADADENVKINVDGVEYELVLTLKSSKEICKRFGGTDEWERIFSEDLTSEGMYSRLDDTAWLITLWANQSVLIHNLKNPDNPKKLLTQDELELLVPMSEFLNYRFLLSEVAKKGAERSIESEDNVKNSQGA